MVNELWREFAVCRGMNHSTWYPEQSDHETAAVAKAKCSVCPVQIRCLQTAVAENESSGIRGGLGEDQRRRLRRNWREMESGEQVGGRPRFDRLCRVTVDMMNDGHEPEWIAKRNTDGATCGRIATWNRGCRCSSCLAASAAVSYLRKVMSDEEAAEYITAARDELADNLAEYTPDVVDVDQWDIEAAELQQQYDLMKAS